MFLNLCSYGKASQNNFGIPQYLSQNVKDKRKNKNKVTNKNMCLEGMHRKANSYSLL